MRRDDLVGSASCITLELNPNRPGPRLIFHSVGFCRAASDLSSNVTRPELTRRDILEQCLEIDRTGRPLNVKYPSGHRAMTQTVRACYRNPARRLVRIAVVQADPVRQCAIIRLMACQDTLAIPEG